MENIDLGLNLGFSNDKSIDDLLSKIEILEKSISNINEVSNIEMFTNALKSFQDLKKEIKTIKELFTDVQKNGSKSDNKNPYKNETFNASQTLKNIENVLKEISNFNKASEHKEKVKTSTGKNKKELTEEEKNINRELKSYYNSQGRVYKDKKVNTEKISNMTEDQFKNGFSKLVDKISKEVAVTLDKNVQDKMVNAGSIEYLKANKGSVKSNEDLDKLYLEISKLVKEVGMDGNILKNNSKFKKEYDNIKRELDTDRRSVESNNEKLYRKYGLGSKNLNMDGMTSNDIKSLLADQRKLINTLSSKRFTEYKKGENFSSTNDKLRDFKNTQAEKYFNNEIIKSRGTSFRDNLNNNVGTILALGELSRHLGSMTNFITSKTFERNMGALGIVGQLGDTFSQNYAKNRVISESNRVNSDVNEFSLSVREVIKTGKTYEQSMNLVSMAGKIAIASFEDLTTATNILNSRFTALNLNATDKNLNNFANRLQSALDNTSLDLQDVNNAGKQTNTAMNALINSAEEKGTNNRTIEQYTIDVSNLELALLSTLKQQGKSGEQSGVVLRTLFTKLMSVDGVGAKRLDNDLKRVSGREASKIGFRNSEELVALVQGGEIEKAIQGLSKLQKQGIISYGTLKKLFTERHSSAISTLLSEVNGDVDKFIDKITTGVDVNKNFGKAMENWSVKADRIAKNLNSISINTFSRGGFGALLGTGVSVVDTVTDLITKGQSSDNTLLRSFSQSIPQTLIQTAVLKNGFNFLQGRAYNRTESAFDLARNKILSTEYEDAFKKQDILNNLNNLKNENLDKIASGRDLNKFIIGSTTNVHTLSNSIKQASESGQKDFTALTLTAKELGTAIFSLAKPLLIIGGMNLTLNAIIGYFEKLSSLRNEANNLDKDIINLSKIGSEIENLNKNIDTIFDVTPMTEDNSYISNVNKIIMANEGLKASIDSINNIKNNPFKSLNTIMDDLYKDKIKNNLSSPIETRDNYVSRVNLEKEYRNVLEDFSVRLNTLIPKNLHSERFISDYEVTTGNNVNYFGTYTRDMSKVYKGDKFKNIQTLNQNELQNLSTKEKENKYNDVFNSFRENKKELQRVDKLINNLYTDAEKKFKQVVKERGLNEKDISKEDKDNYMKSLFSLSNELVSDVFGENVASKFNGKDVSSVSDLSKLISSLGGKNLEENLRIFDETISSGEISSKTRDYIYKSIETSVNVIKEGNELYYKQLERVKEGLEQTENIINEYKSKLNNMFEKAGIPTIATGSLLKEEKDEDGKLLTLEQSKLDVYNSKYNTEINSLPQEMFENNLDGVKQYQAGLSAYYQKRAGLEKQIEIINKNIEEAKTQGDELGKSNLEKQLKSLNLDKERLEFSLKTVREDLHLSNFNAKNYKELLSLATEFAKLKSQYTNMVGSSFGNKGSDLQTQYDSLRYSRALFDKVGKANYDNQINNAYIQDSNANNLKLITGKSSYESVDLNDYKAVKDRIDYYRKNNITEKDNITLDMLEKQSVVISSLIATKTDLSSQELQFSQQEKQIQIEITKHYLERTKLLANMVVSADTINSDFDIKSSKLNFGLRGGEGKYGSVEELQRVTNLKLENSNLKMKDQLDYAKRQLLVAKENSMRQINAIRRLEGKNTSNSTKSDTNAKNNTNSTNQTIINSTNNLSNNINTALQTIMTSIQGFGSNGGAYGGVSNFGVGTGGNYTQLPQMQGKGYKNFLPLAQEVERMTGVPSDLLSIVVGQESGYNPNAKTFAGKTYATGLGQFIGGYTSSYVKQYGSKYGINQNNVNLLDSRQNLVMLAEALSTHKKRLESTGLSYTNSDIYMSHMNNNWYKHLSNLDVPADRLFTSFQIKNNTRNQFYNEDGSLKTLRQVRDWTWDKALTNSRKQGFDNSNSFSKKIGNNSVVNIDEAMVVAGSGNLRIKEGSKATGGGKSTKSTYEFAQLIQDNIQGFKHITAMNDYYHQSKEYLKKGGNVNSPHRRGQGIDFTLTDPKNSNQAIQELKQLANMYGYDVGVLDEYRNPTKQSTGGHIHATVRGRKSNNGQQLLNNVSLPSQYIPNIDGKPDERIKEIMNYENYKELIKTERDAEELSKFGTILQSLKGKTYKEGIEVITAKRNELRSIMTAEESFDVTSSVMESALQDFMDKRERGSENFETLKNNFVEVLTELQFSFRELNHLVNSTNRDYSNAFNFLNEISLTETLSSFQDKIEETRVKLDQYNRKLDTEVEYSAELRLKMFGLLDKSNIAIEGNPMDTGSDMKRFLTNDNQMLKLMEILEGRIENSLRENFNVLGFSTTSLRSATAEQTQELIEQTVTSLNSENNEKGKDIFSSNNDLVNYIELYKTTKSYLEKSNEARKIEIDLIKQNNKFLSDYNKNISTAIKEITILDGSKVRNLRTSLAENELLRKGIPLDSSYGKSYLSSIDRKNKAEDFSENIRDINRLIKYDNSLRSIMRYNGYTGEQLDNLDITKDPQKYLTEIANMTVKYQENASSIMQEEVDKLLDKYKLKNTLKDFDGTDIDTIRNMNAEDLANKSGNDLGFMEEFIKEMNILRNSYQDIGDVNEKLINAITSSKNSYDSSTKMYQELYKQSFNLLSDILFGESSFKGLTKEQYSQALDSILQLGISSLKDFNKESKKENNISTTNALLNTKTLESIKNTDTSLLSSKSLENTLIASSDKSIMIIPKDIISSFIEKSNEFSIPEQQNSILFNRDRLGNYDTIGEFKNFNPKLDSNISNSELRNKVINNDNSLEDTKNNNKKAQGNITTLALSGLMIVDGIMKQQMNYKKQELEYQAKILELNLQMVETSEERRRIEEQILNNKLSQIDTEYSSNSSFLGGAVDGSAGFGLQGALSGAMQGATFGGVGAIVGAGLGLVSGIFGGNAAKIQAEQQKAQLIAQQKLTWLAEDRNKYLKTMASAMSEQAKWTTKIGVNDAISRSVISAVSKVDNLGGTAYDTRTVQNKKKKGGGLLGSKKYETVQSFTASYNTNDSMFGGRVFDDRTDLDYAYGILANRILGNKLLTPVYGTIFSETNNNSKFGKLIKQNTTPSTTQGIVGYQYENSLSEYINKKISSASVELNQSQFLKYFRGQGSLGSDGLLIDSSRDSEIKNLITTMKEQYTSMGASQEKVDMLALINFYENIQALLDKEGVTTKRLFGNYFGIETEEVKDEQGNITEYRRVNESMYSDFYQQMYTNILQGGTTYDVGSKFLGGVMNAFIQNVSDGRGTIKSITEDFNALADKVYEVVTRTGEFGNVDTDISNLITKLATLTDQTKEAEEFAIELTKKWVDLGGNITDVVKDMNNGLTATIDSIKTTLLGASLEDTINTFGSNMFSKLSESMTTNLVNSKYSDSIFNLNSLLTNATSSNSISDIVSLANGYKGLSVKLESDRERLSAIQRLFTANRDIDYVDESIQYETGTSQSVTNNYTFTTDINAGTIVADELSRELLVQNLFAPLVQMLKDNGFIK